MASQFQMDTVDSAVYGWLRRPERPLFCRDAPLSSTFHLKYIYSQGAGKKNIPLLYTFRFRVEFEDYFEVSLDEPCFRQRILQTNLFDRDK